MEIKKILRNFGIDLVRYRSFWETTVRPRKIVTLLDIGANTGAFASEFRTKFPNVFIHSFEPLPDCFKTLEESMQGDANFKAWNVALGDERGEVSMHESSFHPSSSLLQMSALHKKLYPKSAGSKEVKVKVERLDDVFAGTELKTPLMLKIDVQGFEDHVLRGAPKILSHASIVLVETSFVPLYEGQPLFADVHELMRVNGFSYHGRAEAHFNERGEIMYEDSIFLKSL
ncbi:FkbM family methyltransferase [Candidatus Parcubacteria bacterium]|nr:FkbM family methyltransferase [Candidatus Parcubacteria bacterium]